MTDPLSQIIGLLRPQAIFTKRISGAGTWGVRYADFGNPSFAIVLEGSCLLSVNNAKPLTLEAGDFVLLPATPGFTMSGFDPVEPTFIDPHVGEQAQDEIRHGDQDGPASVRILGGYFVFDNKDSNLLVSLIPTLIHVRGMERLSILVKLLADEATQQRAGRELMLTHYVEILLVESLRLTQTTKAPAGLLRGLGDDRLAEAIRQIHADPARPWTMAQLAKETALSRSAFFERFTRQVGMPPMAYLAAWRMALAKDMLMRQQIDIAEVAERVGYSSASAFSTAFSRHTGTPPGKFAMM